MLEVCVYGTDFTDGIELVGIMSSNISHDDVTCAPSFSGRVTVTVIRRRNGMRRLG